MKHFDVTIRRVEHITFRVAANDAEEADENVYGGDEIAAKTIDTETLSIVEVPHHPPHKESP